MTATYFAGKTGAFKIATVAYAMKNWKIKVELGRIDITNFNSPSYWRQFLNGFRHGTITASGVLDSALAQPDDTAAVAYECDIGGTNKVAGSGVITSWAIGTDIDGSATYEVEITMTGAATVTLS